MSPQAKTVFLEAVPRMASRTATKMQWSRLLHMTVCKIRSLEVLAIGTSKVIREAEEPEGHCTMSPSSSLIQNRETGKQGNKEIGLCFRLDQV